MPERSTKNLVPVTLEERVDRILNRHLSMIEVGDLDAKAQILLKTTVRTRILAQVLRHLRDFDSLQDYIVDLIDRDVKAFLPPAVLNRIEKILEEKCADT